MIQVIIVEDDPMVVKFNKYYLEQVPGFQLAAVAHSGEEALCILETQKIDLILLDIYIPGVNGLELLSRLRKKDAAVDVIVVSAAHDSVSIKRALQYGAVDYLIKPFEFDRFKAALIGYKEREKLIRSHGDLSQGDLDKHFLSKDKADSAVEVPKGLDRNTLKLVWEHIAVTAGVAFSTEEMANSVGISRVSMRKYLQFLEEAGALKRVVLYGAPGRPTYKFICTRADSSYVNML